MADYYSQATIMPLMPKRYITKPEIALLERFGFYIEGKEFLNASLA